MRKIPIYESLNSGDIEKIRQALENATEEHGISYLYDLARDCNIREEDDEDEPADLHGMDEYELIDVVLDHFEHNGTTYDKFMSEDILGTYFPES